MNVITLGIEHFIDPTKGKAIASGNVYVGEPDTDPEVVSNQKTITLRQEDATVVATSQPVTLSAGGVPLYNGSPVQILVDGNYSLKITNSLGAQVYYIPNWQNINVVSGSVLAADYTELQGLTGADAAIVSVVSRATIGDGGGGPFYWNPSDLSAEVALDTLSGIYVPPNSDVTGASGAWVRQYDGDIQLLWFGLSSVGDSTATIQGALDAFPGKTIIVPYGVFDYTSISLGSGTRLIGLDRFSSNLNCTSATGTAIFVDDACSIEHIKLTHDGRTLNATIQVDGNHFVLDDCEINDYFIGVDVGTLGIVFKPRISNCIFSTTNIVSGSVAILGTNYSNLEITNTLISGTPAGSQPSSGISLLNGDTSLLSDINITRHGCALRLSPTAGLNLYATTVSGCLFDSAGVENSAEINPIGNVYSTKIVNSWFGLSSAVGCLVTTSAGVVDGICFVNCEFVGNTSHGLQIDSASVLNAEIIGGWSSGNGGNGYYFSGGVTDFILTSFVAGNVGGRGVNTGYGVKIDASSDDYFVGNGISQGNTAGEILNSTSTTGIIVNVIGYNPVGYAGIVVGASPFSYTSGDSSEAVYISGGTVSAIDVGGTTVLTASPCTIPLGPHETVSVTYTVAPTMNKFIH